MGLSIVWGSFWSALYGGTTNFGTRCPSGGEHWYQQIFDRIDRIYFKEIAVACSILTLDGGCQLFWAALDLLLTVVPLVVAFRLEINDFWTFKKIIQKPTWVMLSKEMAVAYSIFTLDGWFQLFLAAFDLLQTVVQLNFV